MRKQYIFIAFDGNMSTAHMTAICNDAKKIGTGILHNCQLDFRGNSTHSLATLMPDFNSFVHFTAWSISLTDVMALDRYYQYPTEYTKVSLMVDVGGKRREGFTYLLNSNYYYITRQCPSSQLKSLMREAYTDCGVDIVDWPKIIF